MTKDVALLIQQRNHPVIDTIDHTRIPGKPTRSGGLTRLIGPNEARC